MEALTWAEILSRMFYQLIPVWVAMIAMFSLSIYYKRKTNFIPTSTFHFFFLFSCLKIM